MPKDLVTAPLVIEGEKNLDHLTLEQLIDCNYEQDPLPTKFYSCWPMEPTIPNTLL